MEPAFLLMYYGGFSWQDTQFVPVSFKRWFIERIGREINRTSEAGNTASRGAHHNTADVRSAQGRAREQVPSRLRRFS